MRLYDTRFLDRRSQVQHSKMEVIEFDREGRETAVHRSETKVRWTFRAEHEARLREAGFTDFEFYGGFDREPVREDAGLVVVARTD